MMFAAIALGIAIAAGEPRTAIDPGAFPVPVEKGMKLDPKATEFRLPWGLARVERFYRDRFAGRKDVAFARIEQPDRTALTIRSLSKADRWTQAVVTAEGATCRIVVSRVIVMDPETVSGPMPVQFIVPRSGHVTDQLDSIDHVAK